MKKFLLVMGVMLLTMGASAQQRAPKLPVLQKNHYTNKALVANPAVAKQRVAQMMNANNASKKAMKQARAEVKYTDLIPAISEEIYDYVDSLGFYKLNMYTGASFLVSGSKAYFAPFPELNYIEGVVESGDCWRKQLYQSYGINVEIDSITFTVNTVIAADKEGNEYVAAEGRYDETTYTAERTNATTIGAYYFPEYNELRINDIIGLYDKEGKVSTPVTGYCVGDLDLVPLEDVKDYFYNATFSVKDDFDKGEDAGKVYEGDALAYMAYDGIYVKGFDLYTGLDGNFVKFSFPEVDTEEGYDRTMATIKDFQIFCTVQSKTGDVYTIFTRGVANTWDAYTTPGFFVNTNEDGTISVESDGMAYLLGLSPALGGSIEALKDLNITISTEKTFAGISTANTAKSTTTEYFDLQGRKVNGSQKGLLIKKSILSDGTVKSVKMLNK